MYHIAFAIILVLIHCSSHYYLFGLDLPHYNIVQDFSHSLCALWRPSPCRFGRVLRLLQCWRVFTNYLNAVFGQ